MAKSITQEFIKGLWDEVPPFRLVLGLCPVLGVTTTMENGIYMGGATTFVLLCSNILVSVLRNVIPAKVRIACYIIIIATFVIVVEQIMQAYPALYPMYIKLGVFIPLIVVNCIVLGRAEAFASKNNLVRSIADAMGIGIGFTLSLSALGALREIIGKGTLTLSNEPFFYVESIFTSFKPFLLAAQPPGAFICLGLMLCIMNIIGKK